MNAVTLAHKVVKVTGPAHGLVSVVEQIERTNTYCAAFGVKPVNEANVLVVAVPAVVGGVFVVETTYSYPSAGAVAGASHEITAVEAPT